MTTRTFTAVLIVICLLPTLIASAQPQFFLYDYDFSRNTAAIASHWEQVGLRDDNISSLAVPSNNGDIVYAGTDGFRHGVFYTPNRGSTWRAVNTGLGELDIRFLLLGNPSSDDVVYAFGKDTLWKTLDHGGHWTSVSLPWPEAHPACTFDVLSVSANRVLYASLWKILLANSGQLWYTVNIH